MTLPLVLYPCNSIHSKRIGYDFQRLKQEEKKTDFLGAGGKHKLIRIMAST